MSSARATTGILVALAMVCTTSVLAALAHACTCAEPPTVPEARAASEALFTGRVTEVEVGDFGFGPAKRVVLELDAVWKGRPSDPVTIYTGTWDGDCGINFELDVDYLVYADEYGSPETKRLYTYLCGRTALAAGNPDFKELGPPQVVPTLGTTWGQVRLIWR